MTDDTPQAPTPATSDLRADTGGGDWTLIQTAEVRAMLAYIASLEARVAYLDGALLAAGEAHERLTAERDAAVAQIAPIKTALFDMTEERDWALDLKRSELDVMRVERDAALARATAVQAVVAAARFMTNRENFTSDWNAKGLPSWHPSNYAANLVREALTALDRLGQQAEDTTDVWGQPYEPTQCDCDEPGSSYVLRGIGSVKYIMCGLCHGCLSKIALDATAQQAGEAP